MRRSPFLLTQPLALGGGGSQTNDTEGESFHPAAASGAWVKATRPMPPKGSSFTPLRPLSLG